MAANWYDRYVLPRAIDCACGAKPFRLQRQKVVPHAHGDVLEIGIGTARNAPFYDKTKVRRIVGVDPVTEMHPLARKRIADAGLSVELVGLSADQLPLDDATFDSVVCTYTLCSVPDPFAALAELRRVLRPGGCIYFSEHGLAPDESVRRWQRRLQPLWGPLAGGCSLSLDVPRVLREAGFDAQIESRYIPGPRVLCYHYWGQATVVA